MFDHKHNYFFYIFNSISIDKFFLFENIRKSTIYCLNIVSIVESNKFKKTYNQIKIFCVMFDKLKILFLIKNEFSMFIDMIKIKFLKFEKKFKLTQIDNFENTFNSSNKKFDKFRLIRLKRRLNLIEIVFILIFFERLFNT